MNKKTSDLVYFFNGHNPKKWSVWFIALLLLTSDAAPSDSYLQYIQGSVYTSSDESLDPPIYVRLP